MQRVVKPKTKRAKRALEARAPKIVENPKSAIYLVGHTCNQLVKRLFHDFHSMSSPFSKFLSRKHEGFPFEDDTILESFAKKYDSSLFMFGSHSKKRPNNIVMGRMYDYHVLDMIELGVDKVKFMSDFKNQKPILGSKPALCFQGDGFETDDSLRKVKSVLMDHFRGPQPNAINLAGIDHVICFSAVDGKIHMRQYRIVMKKSGSRLPLVELDEIGPSAEMTLRRTRFASTDLMKEALKVPKVLKPRKVKNIDYTPLGDKMGRIHLQSQDLGKLQTRKVRALKRKAGEDDGAEAPAAASSSAAAAASADPPAPGSANGSRKRSRASTRK